MSESKNKADKVVAYLESNSHPGHGFHRIFGSMKRKELNAIRDGIADLIDGKEPPAVELKPLPVVKPADAKPAAANKAASKPAATGAKPAQA
jgi:hypothetical protein